MCFKNYEASMKHHHSGENLYGQIAEFTLGSCLFLNARPNMICSSEWLSMKESGSTPRLVNMSEMAKKLYMMLL